MTPRTRPWNRAPQQVYSLVTRGPEDGWNANIMTYVVPVSMDPKYYLLALFKDTRTLDNWQQKGGGVLQFLSAHQSKLLNTLGKVSGSVKNKHTQLVRQLVYCPQMKEEIIDGIYAAVKLRQITMLPHEGGDHLLFLSEVEKYKNYNANPPLLYHR